MVYIGLFIWFMLSLIHLIGWVQTEQLPLLARFAGSALFLLSYMLES